MSSLIDNREKKSGLRKGGILVVGDTAANHDNGKQTTGKQSATATCAASFRVQPTVTLRSPSEFFVLARPSFFCSCSCSRLHLVDAELKLHKGREKQLLRKYEAEFGQADPISGAGRHGVQQQPGTKSARQKSVVELAQEQEARRVEATLQASLDRIMSRKNNRR